MALASFESRETGHCNCPAAVLGANWKNGGSKKISFSGNWLSHPARYIGKSQGTHDDVRIFCILNATRRNSMKSLTSCQTGRHSWKQIFRTCKCTSDYKESNCQFILTDNYPVIIGIDILVRNERNTTKRNLYISKAFLPFNTLHRVWADGLNAHTYCA